MRFIEVEQTRNPKRPRGSQRGVLNGLRLGRIGRIAWLPGTPSNRGMLRKVSHLVRINHDPAAPKTPLVQPVHDEAADIALTRKLAFDGKGIELETYSDAALKSGRTPDFKLYKNGKLVGFSEIKSARDDFVFEHPAPGDVAIRKNLPFHRKIGSHIKRAATQFDAVNPDHSLPNILVFVSHASDIARRDLHSTIVGLPAPEPGKRIFMLGRKMQDQVHEAARKVGLFLWIDAEKGTYQHVSVAGAPHQAAALDLLDLKNEDGDG